jgi:hypothetical protein
MKRSKSKRRIRGSPIRNEENGGNWNQEYVVSWFFLCIVWTHAALAESRDAEELPDAPEDIPDAYLRECPLASCHLSHVITRYEMYGEGRWTER